MTFLVYKLDYNHQFISNYSLLIKTRLTLTSVGFLLNCILCHYYFSFFSIVIISYYNISYHYSIWFNLNHISLIHITYYVLSTLLIILHIIWLKIFRLNTSTHWCSTYAPDTVQAGAAQHGINYDTQYAHPQAMTDLDTLNTTSWLVTGGIRYYTDYDSVLIYYY